MKSPYVKELEANRNFTATFLVRSKEIREKKTGEPYLSLSLCDRTGEVEAKMWDNVAEVMDTFERDDFVKVKGLIQVYHNRPQLTIHKMRRLQDSEVDFADYFPASGRDPEEMWRELRAMIAGMTDTHLRALVEAVLDDPEIASRYRKAPAAKQIHHAWLGGLLEHVLSLCQLCHVTAGHYGADVNLLLAGAVLHDVGKVYELSYDRSFGYTTEGQLLGHMVIGLRIVGDKLRGIPDFPPRLRTLVEHMIVSHHGRYEFGSPKPSYNVSLERTVLKKAKYMANAADVELPAERPPAERGSAVPSSVKPTSVEPSQAHSAPAPSVPPNASPSGAQPVPKEASHPLFAAPPAQES